MSGTSATPSPVVEWTDIVDCEELLQDSFIIGWIHKVRHRRGTSARPFALVGYEPGTLDT